MDCKEKPPTPKKGPLSEHAAPACQERSGDERAPILLSGARLHALNMAVKDCPLHIHYGRVALLRDTTYLYVV